MHTSGAGRGAPDSWSSTTIPAATCGGHRPGATMLLCASSYRLRGRCCRGRSQRWGFSVYASLVGRPAATRCELPGWYFTRCAPNQGRGIEMRNFITKGLGSVYIDVPALRPGTVGAYAPRLRVRWGCHGAAARCRSICCGRPVHYVLSRNCNHNAGWRVCCAVLSTAAAALFVPEPRWSFNVEDPADVADPLLFGPLAAYCAIASAGRALQSNASGQRGRYEPAKIVCSRPSTQGSWVRGSTIHSTASFPGMGGAKKFLPSPTMGPRSRSS
jgi:hypothetical protein